MKKLLVRTLAGVVAVFAVLGITQGIASESGEVVILTTRDAAGAQKETRLWIVEHEGHAWLRAGAEAQGWYQRLKAKPLIELQRGEETALYTAMPVPAERDVINGLMLEKYGLSDQYIGILFGRDDAIPIRLDER